jgi:hypothetical protein
MCIVVTSALRTNDSVPTNSVYSGKHSNAVVQIYLFKLLCVIIEKNVNALSSSPIFYTIMLPKIYVLYLTSSQDNMQKFDLKVYKLQVYQNVSKLQVNLKDYKLQVNLKDYKLQVYLKVYK